VSPCPAVTRVLDALGSADCRPRREGRGYRAPCPCHRDKKPSLSIDEGRDGQALVHCHAGCDTRAILQALKLTWADLSAEGGRRWVARPLGLTLSDYAAAKGLPLDFLAQVGVAQCKWRRAPALSIPYRDPAGVTVSTRLRIALGGDNRFRWRRPAHPCLYGLERLAEVRADGFVVLTEGESDSHTLWFHGIPALALPSAASWREEWARHLAGIGTIYLPVESDAGGDAIIRALRSSSIRSRVRLVRLPVKDPSALYLADPDGFQSAWGAALTAARPWGDDELVAFVKRRGGWATPREVSRVGPRVYRGRARAAERALDGLRAAGLGWWEVGASGPQGGRPPRTFVLNPV